MLSGLRAHGETYERFGATTFALPLPKLRITFYARHDQVTGRIAERALARRPREELMPALRSALAHPHTIFFRIRDDDVEIVRVLHEARDFPAVFATDQEKPE